MATSGRAVWPDWGCLICSRCALLPKGALLFWAALLVLLLCSCGVRWVLRGRSDGIPAWQWKKIPSHRNVWLKPDQRCAEEQLCPLGSSMWWGLIKCNVGLILTGYSWWLQLKHGVDLYSSTSCVCANVPWEEREHFWAPSLCLCNQYPLLSPADVL